MVKWEYVHCDVFNRTFGAYKVIVKRLAYIGEEFIFIGLVELLGRVFICNTVYSATCDSLGTKKSPEVEERHVSSLRHLVSKERKKRGRRGECAPFYTVFFFKTPSSCH